MPDNIYIRTALRRISLSVIWLQVDELYKPSGVWCLHCAPGRGGCHHLRSAEPDVCPRNGSALDWDSRSGAGVVSVNEQA